MKSVLYTALTDDTTITTDTALPTGAIVRRYGNAINANGDAILLKRPGYYNVDVIVNDAPTAAGEQILWLTQDGSEVLGTKITRTVAAGTNYVLPISATARIFCNTPNSVLKVMVNGATVPTVISNFTVRVTEV